PGLGRALRRQSCATARFVLDPAAFGEPLEHAGDGRGTDLQTAREVHRRNQPLRATEAMQRLEVILNGSRRLIRHGRLFHGYRRSESSCAPASRRAFPYPAEYIAGE